VGFEEAAMEARDEINNLLGDLSGGFWGWIRAA
jgi:hypothetical protein